VWNWIELLLLSENTKCADGYLIPPAHFACYPTRWDNKN
jgi:hypothetical protein